MEILPFSNQYILKKKKYLDTYGYRIVILLSGASDFEVPAQIGNCLMKSQEFCDTFVSFFFTKLNYYIEICFPVNIPEIS